MTHSYVVLSFVIKKIKPNLGNVLVTWMPKRIIEFLNKFDDCLKEFMHEKKWMP